MRLQGRCVQHGVGQGCQGMAGFATLGCGAMLGAGADLCHSGVCGHSGRRRRPLPLWGVRPLWAQAQTFATLGCGAMLGAGADPVLRIEPHAPGAPAVSLTHTCRRQRLVQAPHPGSSLQRCPPVPGHPDEGLVIGQQAGAGVLLLPWAFRGDAVAQGPAPAPAICSLLPGTRGSLQRSDRARVHSVGRCDLARLSPGPRPPESKWKRM